MQGKALTVLTDIEATINTHPLTYMYIGADIKDARIITPALLATGKDPDGPTDNPIKKVRV